MAKKKPEDAEATEEDKAPKKKGGLIPALVVALAVLGGGAMAGGLIGGGDEAAAADVAAPEPTVTPMELGAVIDLDPVTLNLAGEGSHFLKLGVSVETGPDVAEEPPTAPIYDAVIELFADYTYDELTAPSVREDTKAELLDRLGEVYGEDIVRVFYTEFVMQ